MSETIGRIHSVESCGTVDGPGVRFVVFMQGCPLRCQYCHNPDTWDTSKGKDYTTKELMREIVRYKSYMKFSGGGVTFTGGEPLLQFNFILEMVKLCKAEGISVAIDTSGYVWNDKISEILEYTDIVLLDIKNYDPDVYENVTGASLAPTLDFLEYLHEKDIKVWVRYVLVPNLTDNLESIEDLASYLKDFSNVIKIELLPFHKMGEYKWQEMGLEYKLTDTKEPTKDLLKKVSEILETTGIPVKVNI
ncbi:MAG: pyruvate formate-lyase-activating protein [Anaerocolumna sp.]